MKWLTPKMPDYDGRAWRKLPFQERVKLACQGWALDGYGAPLSVFVFYLSKIALYVWCWVFFCAMSPSLGGVESIESWWFKELAFKKAIVWSLLFEFLGLGCGSGPLTGRNIPPFGGALYFLRPGAVKLSLWPKLPWVGGERRRLVDIVAYLAVLVACVLALVAPEVQDVHISMVVGTLMLASVCDKTLFLVARGEHYAVMLGVFLLAGSTLDWVAGGQLLACCLWFFAGVSKLNAHFPSVVAAMISNSATFRPAFLRRAMYKSFPEDLHPSRLATWMAHMGTALELSVPIVLLMAGDSTTLTVGLVMMVILHLFITSHIPAGVPLEWNVLVVYAGFLLFGAHPGVAIGDANPSILLFLALTSVLVPLLGNFFPRRVSFLPSMRYYAGNWAYSLWFFRGDCVHKLKKNLPMTSPWVADQLGMLYDEEIVQGIMSRPVGFRLMHLHGRVTGLMIPRLLQDSLADYEWVDGEVVAGLVLGWNFGDGHLHDERLLKAVQEACAFEEGELRCMFVESQPLGGDSLEVRLWDAATGRLHEERVLLSDLKARQTWQLG